ncbi:MAG: hypothetical protein QF704_09310 [Anaerolineales bacterium]|nr:hypothetical protein [Anaerolineales bacterium]
MSAKIDLRYKIERPDDAINGLLVDLAKINKGDIRYKQAKIMKEYIEYLEAKLDRKDKNFQRMKKTIAELEGMTK